MCCFESAVSSVPQLSTSEEEVSRPAWRATRTHQPPIIMSSADDPVHAFFHTNRGVREPPAHANLVAHTGWWADSHDMRQYELRTTTLFKRDEFPYHAKFAGLQGWKYQWLEGATTASASRSDEGFSFHSIPEPWLLLDTDVVVQCSAAEIRERFSRFGAPLVVGAEFQWWPKRDKVALARGADPWAPQPPPSLRYPNSGLLAGTRFGFRQLEHAFRESSPRYPCCPKLHNGSASRKCHIDDQRALPRSPADRTHAMPLRCLLRLRILRCGDALCRHRADCA